MQVAFLVPVLYFVLGAFLVIMCYEISATILLFVGSVNNNDLYKQYLNEKENISLRSSDETHFT